MPFGYQIKCPMPNDAKFSPAFHEVRPATVPPHSFCQILLPIRRVSAGERLIPADAWLVMAIRARKRNARPLDARAFFSSMAVPAAPRFRSLTAPGTILMKRL